MQEDINIAYGITTLEQHNEQILKPLEVSNKTILLGNKNERVQSPFEPSKPSIRDTNIRWLVLVLGTLTNFGSFFCYDNPQPLQKYIEEIFQIQTATANLLYSLAILPNVIVPFFGGALIDSIGVRATMFITSLLVLIGQTTVTLGAAMPSFNVMILGRIIFGFGYATLENALLIMLSKWFLRKNMSFAWGFARCGLRTSSALNSVLCPKFYAMKEELYFPFLMGTLLTLISFICVFGVIYLDKKADAETNNSTQANLFEKVLLKDFASLPKMFFFLMIISILGYMSFLGFTINVNSFLVQRFGFETESAGELITIIYLVAGFLSPLMGSIIDIVGKRVVFIFIAVFLALISMFFFIVLADATTLNPNYHVIFGFIGLGLFYSMFSTTIFPSIPLILKPQNVGTALGIMTCLAAIALALYTELIGFIHDQTLLVHSGYFWTQIIHFGVFVVIAIIVIFAYFEDIRGNNGILNKRRKTIEIEKQGLVA